MLHLEDLKHVGAEPVAVGIQQRSKAARQRIVSDRIAQLGFRQRVGEVGQRALGAGREQLECTMNVFAKTR